MRIDITLKPDTALEMVEFRTARSADEIAMQLMDAVRKFNWFPMQHAVSTDSATNVLHITIVASSPLSTPPGGDGN